MFRALEVLALTFAGEPILENIVGKFLHILCVNVCEPRAANVHLSSIAKALLEAKAVKVGWT